MRSNPMMSARRAQNWSADNSVLAPYHHAAGRAQSWEENKLFLSLDFHLASLTEEIQTEAHSSFALPIMARSMCVKRTRNLCAHSSGELEPTMCPSWSTFFFRQLPMFLDSGPPQSRGQYHQCIERHLPQNHPCKNKSQAHCREAFVSALLAVPPPQNTS